MQYGQRLVGELIIFKFGTRDEANLSPVSLERHGLVGIHQRLLELLLRSESGGTVAVES